MRTTLLALAIAVIACSPALADDAILVLDASGSMWGKIDGKTKVEIARAVVIDLLAKIPAERRLGLVAYGHRREGDCKDIEVVVAVGTDRDAIRRAVASMSFKGKTPLSDAVRFAAEKLRYKEAKATVILVTDGAESCNVDPCALGRELEAAGVDFTAHIIGFGLASDIESAGLKCLAEATGGRFVGARNAGELSVALSETVAAPVEAPPVAAPTTAHVILRATELDGGPEITSGLSWTVKPGCRDPVVSKTDAGIVEVDIAPGVYVVSVERPADGLKGEAELEARASAGEKTLTIPLELVLEASLIVTPSEGPAASRVSVAWTGPDREGDYVTVVKPDAGLNEYMSYMETGRGNPVTITLPGEPGDYQMRYVLGAPRRILAKVPVKVVAVEASVTVPTTAVAGSEIALQWLGPNYPSDWITVVKPDAPFDAYQDYVAAKPDDPQSHRLEMPLEPGDYEVRYVLEGKRVLARAPIHVTDVTATLDAPTTVAAGESFEVTWTGPGYPSDWITIVKPVAAFNAYASYVDANKGSPISLTAAKEAGRYEIRYVMKGKRVIAKRDIEVTATAAGATP